jgi:hypothetical protein
MEMDMDNRAINTAPQSLDAALPLGVVARPSPHGRAIRQWKPTSLAKSCAMALVDAFCRAFQGAFFAIWVPPASTFVMVAFLNLYRELLLGKLPVTEILLMSFIGGLGIAGIAFLMGALLLGLWGVPVLFVLRILRIDHPLVACLAAAALTFWRFVVAPANGRPFSEDFTMIVIVAAITGYVAAAYARFSPILEKDVPHQAARPSV